MFGHQAKIIINLSEFMFNPNRLCGAVQVRCLRDKSKGLMVNKIEMEFSFLIAAINKFYIKGSHVGF